MFSWHNDICNRALKRIAAHGQKFISTGNELDGWLDHFKNAHPDVYRKYQAVEKEMNEFWGRCDNVSMENFKQLCNQYAETTIWALDKFIESQKQHHAEEHIKYTQEALKI